MDKVGVITPCYNAEKYIGECVDSVSRSVTLGKFEIKHYVIDDGSTDNSGRIVRGINNNNLTVISNKNNLGQSAARNMGLKACVSEKYVFFLDADDILFQNSLRYLWEAAVRMKSDWIYGDFIKIDSRGKYIGGMDYYGWGFANRNELLLAIFTGGHYFQQNSFYLTEKVLRAGGFNEDMKMAEDLDLAVKLVLGGLLPVHLPGPLYIHRIHRGNISAQHTTDPKLHLVNLREIYQRYKTDLKDIFSAEQKEQVEDALKYNPGLF